MNNVHSINQRCDTDTAKLLEASVIIPALEKTIEHMQATIECLSTTIETCRGVLGELHPHLPTQIHPEIDRLIARLAGVVEATK